MRDQVTEVCSPSVGGQTAFAGGDFFCNAKPLLMSTYLSVCPLRVVREACVCLSLFLLCV